MKDIHNVYKKIKLKIKAQKIPDKNRLAYLVIRTEILKVYSW